MDEGMSRMIAGTKEESVRRYLESTRNRIVDANGVSLRLEGQDWNSFERAYKGGGEIYYVKSGPQSWRELLGSEKYVVIRKNRVSNALLISMN